MSNNFEIPSKYKHVKMMLLVILAILATIGGVTNGDQLFPPKENLTTEKPTTPPAETPIPAPSPNTPDENKELRYKGKKVILTKHAKCRSACREIDSREIGEILANGQINDRKSNPNAQPCPTYALEGKSQDNQTCRVVIADCNNEVRIITVIDLKNKYECHCD